MKKNEPVSLILIFFLFSCLAYIFFNVAYANGDHECQGGHNCNDDGTIIANGSDKIFGLSNSLGGVDIGDCVVTKQWTIILFGHQYYVENEFCQAMKLVQLGFVDAGILKFCRDTSIKDLYLDEKSCKNGMTLMLQEPLTDDEKYQAQEEELEYVQEQLATVLDKFDKQQQAGQRTAQRQRQQYEQIQRAEDARKRKIKLIREEFGEQTTTASD